MLMLISSYQGAVWNRVSLGTRSSRGSPAWRGTAKEQGSWGAAAPGDEGGTRLAWDVSQCGELET